MTNQVHDAVPPPEENEQSVELWAVERLPADQRSRVVPPEAVAGLRHLRHLLAGCGLAADAPPLLQRAEARIPFGVARCIFSL